MVKCRQAVRIVKWGAPVGLIFNATLGAPEANSGQGDVGEYLPDQLGLKDVLNEYTYRQLNAKGETQVIVGHSAGNEDYRKAMQAGALYKHQYKNLSYLSVGSPVSDKTLQQVSNHAGVNYLGQINDWRDPVTHSKTWMAGTLGLTGAVAFAGAKYGATLGSAAGPLPMFFGVLAGAGIGAGVGSLGISQYHPIEKYMLRDDFRKRIRHWQEQQDR